MFTSSVQEERRGQRECLGGVRGEPSPLHDLELKFVFKPVRLWLRKGLGTTAPPE